MQESRSKSCQDHGGDLLGGVIGTVGERTCTRLLSSTCPRVTGTKKHGSAGKILARALTIGQRIQVVCETIIAECHHPERGPNQCKGSSTWHPRSIALSVLSRHDPRSIAIHIPLYQNVVSILEQRNRYFRWCHSHRDHRLPIQTSEEPSTATSPPELGGTWHVEPQNDERTFQAEAERTGDFVS